ncbi:POLR1C [Bugula neritina]|uniref:DNA-directed RNA polymerases I and III subunit RPAC1 n=1 Tax=Bugula neritina TaxID=10212 RepID=A0A7J7JDA7_BUGNE|nr:POLR1C [Bugula neritina]
MEPVKLKSCLKRIKERVDLKEHQIINTNTTDFPNAYTGSTDGDFDINKFTKGVRVDIISEKEDELEFDLVGVDAAIANSLRRILLAEVPTMAIEKVYVYNNTSLIQDEVLAHRLGLIPIKADPRMFEYRQPDQEEGSAEDTISFALKVKCTHNSSAPADATQPDILYKHNNVYTRDMVWVPVGNQADLYPEGSVAPVHPDILINKLKPGQILDLRMDCVKGIGRDHAKFSPVATAHYRLLPEITLTQPITGTDAHKLKECFSDGVIGIRTNDNDEAYVANARLDTCSREVFRHDNLKDKVLLSRVRDHFIFSVESTGALPAATLVSEALKVLMKKCTDLREKLEHDEDS